MIDILTDVAPAVCVEPGAGGPFDPHIRCPLCGWRPQVDSRWICRSSNPCGNRLNPFDTGGVCPACLGQCSHLQCGKCREYSAYSDWYVYKG